MKKIAEIENLPEGLADSEPKWDKGTQRTYLLKRVTRVWIFACLFYSIILLLRGFFSNSFLLSDVFIHQVFSFICLSGVISLFSNYYF